MQLGEIFILQNIPPYVTMVILIRTNINFKWFATFTRCDYCGFDSLKIFRRILGLIDGGVRDASGVCECIIIFKVVGKLLAKLPGFALRLVVWNNYYVD